MKVQLSPRLVAVVLSLVLLMGISVPGVPAARLAAAPDPPLVTDLGLPLGQEPPLLAPAATCTGAVFQKNVAGQAFSPSDSTEGYKNFSGTVYATNLVTGWGFWAAFDLPRGACLSKVTFYVVDNSATAMDVAVYARAVNSQNITGLGSANTGGLPQSLNVQSQVVNVGAVTDSVANVYFLRVEFREATANHTLVTARVEYTMQVTYLPSLMK